MKLRKEVQPATNDYLKVISVHPNKLSMTCCLLKKKMSYAEGFITLPDLAFPALLFFDVLQGVGINFLQPLVLLAAVIGNLICYQLQQALQNQPQNTFYTNLTVMLPTSLLYPPLCPLHNSSVKCID